mgnify:FL=1
MEFSFDEVIDLEVVSDDVLQTYENETHAGKPIEKEGAFVA